jgi:hypothetical protein
MVSRRCLKRATAGLAVATAAATTRQVSALSTRLRAQEDLFSTESDESPASTPSSDGAVEDGILADIFGAFVRQTGISSGDPKDLSPQEKRAFEDFRADFWKGVADPTSGHDIAGGEAQVLQK